MRIRHSDKLMDVLCKAAGVPSGNVRKITCYMDVQGATEFEVELLGDKDRMDAACELSSDQPPSLDMGTQSV